MSNWASGLSSSRTYSPPKKAMGGYKGNMNSAATNWTPNSGAISGGMNSTRDKVLSQYRGGGAVPPVNAFNKTKAPNVNKSKSGIQADVNKVANKKTRNKNKGK